MMNAKLVSQMAEVLNEFEGEFRTVRDRDGDGDERLVFKPRYLPAISLHHMVSAERRDTGWLAEWEGSRTLLLSLERRPTPLLAIADLLVAAARVPVLRATEVVGRERK